MFHSTYPNMHVAAAGRRCGPRRPHRLPAAKWQQGLEGRGGPADPGGKEGSGKRSEMKLFYEAHAS